jgi:hypothetical protein
MGYRSEVGFVLSVDGYDKKNTDSREQFKSLLGFFKLSEFYTIATSPEYDLKKSDADGTGIGWKDGCVMFYASQWKWYEGYPIVEAYASLWEQMQGLDGISGYFCRVGEEIDDIVEETFGDDPNYDFFRPHSYMQLDDTIIGEFEIEPTEEKV